MKLGLKLFPMNGVQRLVDDVTVDFKKLSLNAEKTVVVNIDPIVGFFFAAQWHRRVLKDNSENRKG